MPWPRHEHHDPQAQEAFKKNGVEQVRVIQAQHPDQRVEVWFQDEARPRKFGQQGTRTKVWVLRGSQPQAVRQTRYD